MKEIVLIRGLPGSGKSTLAKQMVRDGKFLYAHCEADDYFTDENGVYRFDPSKLNAAHRACRDNAFRALSVGLSVIVANTFTRLWEMGPYYSLAAAFGCNVRVIVATGQYENVHNVPADVIENMRLRWQE